MMGDLKGLSASFFFSLLCCCSTVSSFFVLPRITRTSDAVIIDCIRSLLIIWISSQSDELFEFQLLARDLWAPLITSTSTEKLVILQDSVLIHQCCTLSSRCFTTDGLIRLIRVLQLPQMSHQVDKLSRRLSAAVDLPCPLGHWWAKESMEEPTSKKIPGLSWWVILFMCIKSHLV